MTDKKYVISWSKNNLPFWPMLFLVFVLIITIVLFFYNTHLKKENSQILSRISKIESTIDKIEKNPEVQVYSLLDMNSSFINKLEKRNDIIGHIKHLNYIQNKYWLDFDWFSYSNWKITTTAKSESTTDNWIAYTKTVSFIKNYRESKDAKFDLEFINSFDWMNTIKYNISFGLK